MRTPEALEAEIQRLHDEVIAAVDRGDMRLAVELARQGHMTTLELIEVYQPGVRS